MRADRFRWHIGVLCREIRQLGRPGDYSPARRQALLAFAPRDYARFSPTFGNRPALPISLTEGTPEPASQAFLTSFVTEVWVEKDPSKDKGNILAETANLEYVERKYMGGSTPVEHDVKRALLVDDHKLFRHALDVLLWGQAGFRENVHAGSFDEARRVLANHRNTLDCAVVDLDLCEEQGSD